MGPNMLTKGVLLTIVFALFGWVAPLGAQEATFTDLHDVVPNRCFSAPLSTVGADFVDIGIESGFDSATWVNKACKASTSAFHTRTAGDTFSVTVTAPPGMRITRVTYAQAGTRYLERSTYWTASGTGTLTVNGVPWSFSFTTPTLSRTVDLADQDVESATVSVMIRLAAGRSSNFPRVTAPPGSASIDVADAVIRVEYESVPDSNHAPVALAVDGTITGTVDQPLVFDGSPSSDQDQDALSYQWDFGDGTSASGVVVTHSYGLPGTYTALLTVSDGVLSSPPYPVSVSVVITAADVVTCTDSFDRSNDSAKLGIPDEGACPGGSWMPVVGTLFINANKASSAALKGPHVAVLPSIAGMNTVEADFTSIQDKDPSPPGSVWCCDSTRLGRARRT